MGIIIFLITATIVGAFIGLLLAGFIAPFSLRNQALAKSHAKRVLATGRLDTGNPKELQKTMGILAKMDNDLEATDLWKRLQVLGQ